MPIKQNKGFTLLEILLVIAAIGILAAIVLVAINPNRQIAQARNTVRQADINTIQKAVEQYLIENGSYPSSITTTPGYICNTGTEQVNGSTNCSGRVDLRELVPTYIAGIPKDPQATGTSTGYIVAINADNNKVSLQASLSERGILVINPLSIVTNGLVLNLDAGNSASYPGTGTTWFDLSGNGRNGTLVNGVGFNSANGGALSFDGVNDYVNFTDKPEFTFTDAKFSLEIFFIYINKTDIDNSIIGKRDYGFTQREYNFYMYEPGSTPILRFIISSNLTANWTIVESSSIQKNTWYHAVATSDAGVGRIYLNGVLNATNNSMNSSIINGTSPLTIGNAFNSGSALQYFNGSIPLARIYNRALTASEIQQNFNATRGRFGL